MKITDDFCCEWEPSHAFAVSKDENKGTGVSRKNAFYVQRYGKRHFLGSNSEKLKLIALAIAELHLSGS